MVVPGNNRRATITGFNRERRSSVDHALFDICRATAVLPSHHDCSSRDALSAPKTRARTLPDNMRRYQDRLGT
ncbi:hypothetical protein DPMN_045081 [Dreissena polymorpha]|uniref:Uncharacterized protein n=1 Tax=Dreissena polymorpha TaxID=45954 RepID=A0A9D4D5D5_DREPO|nr:hypothetical protein DPMN_045081 [Dreissena polymorpha]